MHRLILICIPLLFAACMNPQDQHTITVSTDDDKVVAKISIVDSVLNGTCTWYDLDGKELATGEFKNGKPWEGTILNWAKIVETAPEDPFSYNFYCEDWITFFEISHASQRPDYDRVKEVYQQGNKVNAD